MATADVARLRFILSADAGGLKAGVKEGTGSLKDMASSAGQHGDRAGEQFGEKFYHGSAKKLRALSHVAENFGLGDPQDVGFNQAILNCGYQWLKTPNVRTQANKNLFAAGGIVHGGIGLLNDDGTENTNPANPIYDLWHTKPTADFNDLDLF
jgi:hypothetical protein